MFFLISTDTAIRCSATSRPETTELPSHEGGGKQDSTKGLPPHVSLCSTAPKTCSVLLLIRGFMFFHFKYSMNYTILCSHSQKHPTDKTFEYKQALTNGQRLENGIC